MARTKIKAKFQAKVRPPEGKDKRPPIRPEGGDAGFLSAKILTVVREKKEKEKKDESKGKKD